MKDIIPRKTLNRLRKIFGNQSGEPNAKIYFSRLCSCIGGNNGVYDPTCTACIEGYIYDEPVEELVIRTSMNLRWLDEKLVHIYQGGCNITIFKYDINDVPTTAHYKITQGDIIVMKNDNRRDRDICERGVKDYLMAFDVNRVLSVTEKKRVFKENVDYTVEYDRMATRIVWKAGGYSPTSFYSVEFISEVNYLVWDDMLKSRGTMDTELPKKVACRLRGYFDPTINISMGVDTSFKPINEGEMGT
jgi:hypothetical protein